MQQPTYRNLKDLLGNKYGVGLNVRQNNPIFEKALAPSRGESRPESRSSSRQGSRS